MAAPAFDVSRTQHPAGLRVSGELDLCSSPKLSAALADIGGNDAVHIDLSELTFLDSAGMREILEFAESRTGAGNVVLLSPSEPVRRAIEIGGLDRHPAIEILRREPSAQSPLSVGVAQESATEAA